MLITAKKNNRTNRQAKTDVLRSLSIQEKTPREILNRQT